MEMLGLLGKIVVSFVKVILKQLHDDGTVASTKL